MCEAVFYFSRWLGPQCISVLGYLFNSDVQKVIMARLVYLWLLKMTLFKKKNPKGLNSENTKLEWTHEKLKSVLKRGFDDM